MDLLSPLLTLQHQISEEKAAQSARCTAQQGEQPQAAEKKTKEEGRIAASTAAVSTEIAS